MKNLLLIILVFFTGTLYAKNYYISAKGLDTNNGLSPTSAWQTIAKLNTSFGIIAAGDSILFKCGETFYGSVIVGKSGTSALPIVFSSYGTGDKPLITGFSTLSNWTNVGGGIWKTNVPGASSTLRVVSYNNNLQRMGRYPNFNPVDGGWLTYESWDNTPSITDNQLSTVNNWTGADAVIKKYSYVIDVCPITNQTGGKLTYLMPTDFYKNPTNIYGFAVGYGYFIENDIRTLDTLGEWFLDRSSKDLSFYFGIINPSSAIIKASTIDTLFNCSSGGFGTSNVKAFTNIILSNLSFEGANKIAVYSFNGNNITVKNCTLNNNGNGIIMWNVPNSLSDNDSVTNTLNNAIVQLGEVSSPTNITNNYVKNVGLLEGMSGNGPNANKGIWTSGDNTLIQNNHLDSIGYTGIYFNGSNVLVKNNFVENYCAKLDDGGGIYTFADLSKTNRVIESNVVINGIGERRGRSENSAMTWGLYTDGASTNVVLKNNTVSKADGGGYLINSGVNLIATGNTFYDVPTGVQVNRFPGTATVLDPLNRNLRISSNIMYPTGSNFVYWNGRLNEPTPVDIQTDMRAIGSLDSNYYRDDIRKPFDFYYHLTFGGTFVDPAELNLSAWQQFMNTDYHSNTFKKVAGYAINSSIGTNTITNGQFTSNILNTGFYSPNSNFSIAWDNTSKITGTGSLKITNATSIISYGLVTTNVGQVTSGHQYLVRFKSLGTTYGAPINISFRQTNSPYSTFDATYQYGFTSKSITQQEFLITMPTTGTVTLQIQFSQESGTTYLDDMEFYEVNATAINPDSQVKFVYNAANTEITIPLGAKYLGVDSTLYNGSITLQPYTSAILIKSGILQTTLKADAGTDISLVLPTNNTVLKGSAVGTVISYSWTKISGPDQFTIATPNNPSTAISNLSTGKYTFQFKVINSVGDSAVAMVNVTETGLLPVTLIDFSAKNNNDKIDLQWQVASEINASHYTIERSGDYQHFESIGQLAANDLANIQVNYNFSDNFPLKGNNYYRLVMIDKDGTFSYSKTVSVEVKNVPSFTLFNMELSTGNSNLKINLTTNYQQKMQLVLVDVTGRIIYTNQLQLQKGFNAIDKKIPAINTGVYYAKLFTEQLTVTKPVLSFH